MITMNTCIKQFWWVSHRFWPYAVVKVCETLIKIVFMVSVSVKDHNWCGLFLAGNQLNDWACHRRGCGGGGWGKKKHWHFRLQFAFDIWLMTSWHDSMTNKHFWAYTWKQKLLNMFQESTLSIWHMTYDKQSLLSLHMKTKVDQHVPMISPAWQYDSFGFLVPCSYRD